MSPSIDIIIVNWNAGGQLHKCIESIAITQNSHITLNRVVIVDNASTDDSLFDIENSSLPIFIIRNKENRGFSAACNQGAQDSRADYLLFLNPDTILYTDSITLPVVFLASKENYGVGIIGIQLIDETEHISRSCARFPTVGVFFTKMMGLDRIFPVFFPSLLMNEWNHSSNREVDHVIGAFYMIRRSLFVSLGGFDERFFVYLEDLDLSYRARQTGWKSYYLADAQAFHKGGGASEQIKATRLFYSLRSRIQYGYKHFGFLSATGLWIGTLSLELIVRLVLAVGHGSKKELQETMQGYVLLYQSIPSVLKDLKIWKE